MLLPTAARPFRHSVRVVHPTICRRASLHITHAVNAAQQQQPLSNSATSPSQSGPQSTQPTSTTDSQPPKTKKTQAQLDQELQLKMAGLAGDGGEAGLELEDGRPVSMKRSVKDNMFRYI